MPFRSVWSYIRCALKNDLAGCQRLSGASATRFRWVFFSTYVVCIVSAVVPVWFLRHSLLEGRVWGKVIAFMVYGAVWMVPIKSALDWVLFNFKRVLRVGVYCLIGLSLLIACVNLIENWRGKRAWTTWKASQEAKGVHYEWAGFVPPEVPDSENFAKVPIIQRALQGQETILKDLKFPVPYPAYGQWRLGRRENLEAWSKGYNTSDLAGHLRRWDASLDEFSKAALLPRCRLQSEYPNPGSERAEVPEATPLGFRAVARILRLRALERLEAGQSQGALEDVLTILRASRLMKDEPSLVNQLLNFPSGPMRDQMMWMCSCGLSKC